MPCSEGGASRPHSLSGPRGYASATLGSRCGTSGMVSSTRAIVFASADSAASSPAGTARWVTRSRGTSARGARAAPCTSRRAAAAQSCRRGRRASRARPPNCRPDTPAAGAKAAARAPPARPVASARRRASRKAGRGGRRPGRGTAARARGAWQRGRGTGLDSSAGIAVHPEGEAEPEDDGEDDGEVARDDEAGRVEETVETVDRRERRGRSRRTKVPTPSTAANARSVSRTAVCSTMSEEWQAITVGTAVGTERPAAAQAAVAHGPRARADALRPARPRCAAATASAAASCSSRRSSLASSSRSSSPPSPSRASRSCSRPAASRISARSRSARTRSSTRTTAGCSASSRRRRTASRCRSRRSRRGCREATVAIEDARFWQHGALDYQGIVRALLPGPHERPDRAGRLDDHAGARPQPLHRQPAADVVAQDQGGLPRREALHADQAVRETRGSRSSPTYLNEVFYGRHAYGAEAAAQTYFSKSASKLDARPGGAARRPAAGADGLRPARPIRAPRAPAGTRCCRRCGRTATSPRRSCASAKQKKLELRPGHLYTQLQQPNFFGWATQQLANCRIRPARRSSSAGSTSRRRSTRGCRGSRSTRSPRVLHTSTDPAAAIVAIDPRTGAVKAMVDYLPSGRTMQFNLATQASPLDRQRLQADHARDRAECGRLALLDLLRPAGAEHHHAGVRTNNGPWDVHNFADEAGRNDEPPRRDCELGEHDLRAADREDRCAERAWRWRTGSGSRSNRWPVLQAGLRDHARLGRVHAARAHRRVRDASPTAESITTRRRSRASGAEREGHRGSLDEGHARARARTSRPSSPTRCRASSGAAPAPRPRSTRVRWRARPEPRRTSRTPGSAATSRSSRRASGSGIPKARSRCSTSRASEQSSAARCRREIWRDFMGPRGRAAAGRELPHPGSQRRHVHQRGRHVQLRHLAYRVRLSRDGA